MRRLANLSLGVACFACLPCFVVAQESETEEPSTVAATATTESEPIDPSGAWRWERDFGGDTMRLSLKLDWDGKDLSGVYTSFGEESKIEDAKYADGELSFNVEREYDGYEFDLEFTGKPSDEEITGTVTIQAGNGPQELEWNAKRHLAPEHVVGKWNLRLEGRGGRVMEPTVAFTQENGELKGLYSSRFGDREAKEIKIEAGKLNFEISGEGPQGGAFKSVYTAVVRGDKISGTNEFDFNGRTGELEFTGVREIAEMQPKAD